MDKFNIITLIFSGIVTLSTVVYSILTWKLVRETKLTREFQNTPDISIYLKRAEADASFIYIIFENKGLGYAKDVKFKIIKDFKFYDDNIFYLSAKGIIVNGKENFYPKEKYEYYFTDLSQKYNDKVGDNIYFEITYKDIYNKEHKKTINIELKELIGESMLNPPTKYIGRIAYELKEIRTILKKQKIDK